jgi:hypothetical protein
VRGDLRGDCDDRADPGRRKPRPLIKLSFLPLNDVSTLVAHKGRTPTRIFDDLTEVMYHILCCLTPIGLVISIL